MYQIIKEAGNTMVQTMDKFKKENGINKVCYCGRLDPMARGLVLLLAGDECKKMSEYLGHSKEYEFEILFGISTDTDDPLGIINNINNIHNIDPKGHIYNYEETDINIYFDKIKEYIKIGKFEQDFHSYSSKRIKGQPMWQQPQIHLDIKPHHTVEIFNVEYKPIKKYDFLEWKINVIDTINKIDKKNNFRQVEIINNYNKIGYKFDKLYSIPIKINVSTGFYIRQLVCDIKNHFGINILTYDINRTSIYY
jgi:tRNA pseudouridine(55) synthase